MIMFMCISVESMPMPDAPPDVCLMCMFVFSLSATVDIIIFYEGYL